MATDWWLRMHAEDLATQGDFKAAFETLKTEVIPGLEEKIEPESKFGNPLAERIRQLSNQVNELKKSEEWLIDELEGVRNERDDLKERLDHIKEAISPGLELVPPKDS